MLANIKNFFSYFLSVIVVLQLRFFFKVLSFQITWRAGGAGRVMNEIILNILKGHEGMSYYFLHVYICLKFSRIKVINDKQRTRHSADFTPIMLESYQGSGYLAERRGR